MRVVKRKAEQPTLTAFGFTKKVNGENILSFLFVSNFIFVYQMCRVAIMLRLCLKFGVFFYPNYAYKRLAYNFFLVYCKEKFPAEI